MSTPIKICNSALIKLGVDTLINDFSEDTKEARLCNEQYEKLRDELLQSHYWNFAMKRADLSSLAGVTPSFDWSYAFQLPSDCLRVKELEENEAFVVESDRVLADSSTAKMLYVSKETDVSKYPPIFREALALRIAVDLAYAMVASMSLIDRLQKQFDKAIADARSIDAQEGFNNDLMQDVWLDTRTGGTNVRHPSSLRYSGDGKVIP